MQQVYIDVSELEPPEPMTNILLALAQLPTGSYLKVFHRREPFPLYEKLLEAGWAYQCQALSENKFHIFIYRDTESGKFNQQQHSDR